MIENATVDGHDVVVTGTVADGLRVDGAEGRVAYRVGIDVAHAGAVAADLASHHDGLRLYPADGEYGPLDGSMHEIVEVGAHWHHGSPTLVVTVTGTEVPRLDGRYDLEHLTADDTVPLIEVLLRAAG